MRSTPDLDLLLEAAADTLRQAIIPALDGAPAYQARMVVNILGIAIREMRGGAADDHAELAGLGELLGPAEGDLRDLNRQLAARIRDGDMPLTMPGLLAHLEQTALAAIAVEQPKYARYQEYKQAAGQ